MRNKSGKILDILDDIFKGTDITYTVVDKQIILSTNKMQLVQQEGQIQIKGVVKDAGGDPLIGVNVKVKDSTVGTITDINGNFTLQTRKGDILEISYVGYATKTVKVQNAQVLNIVLTEDTEVLNEVVARIFQVICIQMCQSQSDGKCHDEGSHHVERFRNSYRKERGNTFGLTDFG